MCAPTPLGSANPAPPMLGLRKLRALNRAGAAHYRALGAIASFDSIGFVQEVGRRGNGPTGKATWWSRWRKLETRSGQKGIRVLLESSTGRSKNKRAQRVPHRWAAEGTVKCQGAEGDWKPRHQGDNPWVAVQLKPVTAGAIPAVRKAEARCAQVLLEGKRRLATSRRPKPNRSVG